MKRKSLLYLIVFISSIVYAQKGTIEGRVFNATTNDPIEFANILIEGTNIGVTSDLNGNFIFTGITPGFVRLIISFVGYETTESSEIQVQGNQTTFIDIPVKEKAIQIREVTVSQNRINYKRIESPVSVLSVGVQEIEKSAGANRDVSKVIQTLPGVGVTNPNRNDLIVRGGGPSENVFYLDGIEIPVINHFATQGSSGGAIGVINPDFVREISFYTGAFPANRANALSSVMEIKQKDGSKDRIHTKLSVGASDAALTIDGPLSKKSTFIASARQSYLQFLFKAIGLPFLPTYNDFQIKYKYAIDKKNEISLIGIGAIDYFKLNTDLQTSGTETQKYILSYLPIYKQWNYTIGATFKHYGNKHIDNWILSRNMLRNRNYKYQDNEETLPKVSNYLSDEAENKLRFERDYPYMAMKLKVGGGVKYAHYTNETYRKLFYNNTVNELNYATKLNTFGYLAFAQISDEYFNDKLKLSVGANLIGNNFNKNMRNPLNQFSPRISLSFTITDKMDVNANFGRYAQQPAYTTMGFKDNLGDFINRNEELKFIMSNQAITGIEYRPTDKTRISLEAFYKKYDNYPLSVTDGLSIASKGSEYGQVGDEQIVSKGKGKAYGIELLIKIVEWKQLNLTSTYTYFRSEFTNTNGIYLPSSWDVRNQINLMASYKFWHNWDVALRWRYVGGAPYTPIDLEKSSLKAAWDITNQPYLNFAQFNSLRLSDSHQLDLRIDKEFYFNKFSLNLYADIQNVYNFKSPSVPIYTNTDKLTGEATTDPNDPSRYVLRTLDSNSSGNILPTIGLILKI